MARKIFVGATGQHCGKTTVSLCLLHLARRKYGSVGFIKPVGQQYVALEGHEVDKDVALMAQTYHLEGDLSLMSPVIARHDFTRRVLDGAVSTSALTAAITTALAELERRHPFLVIEGTGHGGVGSVIGLSNARVARLCDAKVAIVVEAGIGSAVDAVNLNRALYAQEGADVRFVLVNKLAAEKRGSTLSYVERAFEGAPLSVLGALDFSPVLADPPLWQIARALGEPLRGDAKMRARIVHSIQLGAASTQRCVDLLRDSTLLVTTSSRDELLVTLAALYNIPAYRDRIAGMVVGGVGPISPTSQQIIDDSGIPHIRCERPTGEIFLALREYVAKTAAEDAEKIALMQRESERRLDFDAIDARL